MCRFSKLLLFSFFFCKDGSDRLMKRASYSCCNFLCIVLASAAAYLKYRLCRLSCLPFVWHPFFHCDTHTHTRLSVKGWSRYDIHSLTRKLYQAVLFAVYGMLRDMLLSLWAGLSSKKEIHWFCLLCFLTVRMITDDDFLHDHLPMVDMSALKVSLRLFPKVSKYLEGLIITE